MMLDSTMLSIILPAFAAGMVVLATHIPLGREVIQRGIIFIDLAVAQIAGLGVIIAYHLGWELHGIDAQVAAVSSALAGAMIMRTIERFAGQFLEAYIGVIFVMAATASILLLANNPHGSEHLKEILVGQILWVDLTQVSVAAFISLTVFVIWYGFRQHIGNTGFYILFAVSITVSVQMVGIYLVFSSLIVPALATIRFTERIALFISVVIGACGYLSGLLLSAVFDLPGGAVIVWCLVVSALCVPVLSSVSTFMKKRRRP